MLRLKRQLDQRRLGHSSWLVPVLAIFLPAIMAAGTCSLLAEEAPQGKKTIGWKAHSRNSSPAMLGWNPASTGPVIPTLAEEPSPIRPKVASGQAPESVEIPEPVTAPAANSAVPQVLPELAPAPQLAPTEPVHKATQSPGKNGNRYIVEQIESSQVLDVQLGRPTILQLSQAPFRDQVAAPEVLEVLNITETEYSITGREVGTTVLNFWFENPESPTGRDLVSYLVRVNDDPETVRRYEALLKKLETEINRAFPNSVARLSYVGNQVVVRGQAKDVEEATQILRIVSRSLPRESQLDTPFAPEQFFVANPDPEALLAAGGVEGLLQGRTQTGANTARINNRIVNLIEVGGVHQVMLKVTVAEVNRSAVRAIGADLRIGGDSAQFFSLLPLAELGVAGTGGTLLVNRGDFDLAINALKQMNLARSLAEPNLVTLNGQPAQFQVGGQFPVPQLSGFTGAGLQGVEFIPFGVQLQFTPNVTDNDRIRLNLQATVSTRTDDTTNIGGANIAGLNSRNFQSTVELREGQTLAIAGLIQSNLGASSFRVPFLGDIPFFGRLFSSDDTSYDEQELMVLVTPYLVNPIDQAIKPLPVPGSDYYEPDDLEFFMRGRLTGRIPEDFRTPARTTLKQIKAFRRIEQEFIIGQPGHVNGLLCPSVSDGRPHEYR